MHLVAGLSTPSGFPSHINAGVLGSIRGGGELGCTLAVAFGPVSRSAKMNIGLLAPAHTSTSKYPNTRRVDWGEKVPHPRRLLQLLRHLHQDRNGFSHQNPSSIGAALNFKADAARVYSQSDTNCFLSTIAHFINSRNSTRGPRGWFETGHGCLVQSGGAWRVLRY